MWALRQSTASQEIPLGPFLDSTDGNTAETGLTIANTDIKLQKSGATSQVNKNSGGATHIATGDYYAVLDATDTDTVGPMRVKVHVAGALPVWLDCFVYEEPVYDALFAASAPGYVANAPVNVAQWLGSAVATPSVAGVPEVDLTHANGTAVTNSDGTAQAGGASSITLAAGSSATTDFYKDNVVRIVAGTGAGQSRVITAYNGATKVATVHEAWATNPDSTSQYVFEGNADVGSGSAPSAADIWSHATRTLTAGTNIQLPANALQNVTAWAVALTGNITGNLSGSVGSVAGLVSADVQAVLGDSDAASGLSGVGLSQFNNGAVSADLDAAAVRSAVGLASANLDTQLSAIDDAVDTEVASLVSSVATVLAAVDTEVAAIKAKTDNLPATFPANFGSLVISAGGVVNADMKAIAGTTLGGTGVTGDEWAPG